ncbi:SSI family serine proteinase inhibitor [Amycolatopsis arida]|nr:SSI family serine proteinase inhibitor [Amycolatopsis arida]
MFPFEPITACALTLACLGGPAAPPEASLTLSLYEVDGAAKTVTLHCAPAYGSHPDPQEACSSLAQAGGDLTKLPVKQQSCIMIYDPVKAVAHGIWRGKPVHFRATYPNSCVADSETGGVFGF